MAAPYDIQPFASSNPTIDALFTREFAQRQGDREAAARAAAASVARAQIGAQSQLAQAQLEEARANQDYNRLFREREFQARQDAEKVRQGQIDRQLKLYEGDPEKVRITSINAAAQAAAARFKAAYDAALETALAKAKDDDIKSLWFNGLWPGSRKTIDDAWLDPKYPKRLKVEMDTWRSVTPSFSKDKDYQLVIPDPNTRTFKPAQLDAAGNLVIPTNNPAALGTPTPAPVGVLPEDPAVTARDIPTTTSSSGVGDLFKAVMAGALPSVFGATPTTTETASPTPAPAPAAAPPAVGGTEYLTPGVRAVRHAAGPNRDVLLLPEDSAIIVRELPMVQGDDRQKAIAYQVMVDQFVKAGRGRYVPRIGVATSPLLMDTNAPNRAPY